MTPEQRDFLIELPDIEVMARTIYGEARNQGIRGMTAVAMVIVNRVNDFSNRFGAGTVNVCLKPWQFSCWNDGDPNLEKLMLSRLESKPMWQSRIVAAMADDGLLVDITNGATHYHHRNIFPWWMQSKGMIHTVDIGDHFFYREV